MPNRTSTTGSELFIVDNSDSDWKLLRYLHDWCQISKSIDIATGYFEIGALLSLQGEWQKTDEIRILMGDEVSRRTRNAFTAGLEKVKQRLDQSLECEKEKNDFLYGVPAIVQAIRSGKIKCRVYRKEKFHAKAYITHARLEVVGSSALVGSANFTYPGLTENIELNVQITGQPVTVLQEWYEQHWADAEDVGDRWLTPRLAKMGLDEKGMGFHAFRRFRKTWLRGTRCLEDLNNFWMAHKPHTMSEVYSHLHEEVEMRLDEAARVGYGFVLPAPDNLSVVPNVLNVPKVHQNSAVEIAA